MVITEEDVAAVIKREDTQDSPIQQNYLAQNFNSAEIKTPDLNNANYIFLSCITKEIFIVTYLL